MPAAVVQIDDVSANGRVPRHENFRSDPIRCVVLDDNRFDRRLIGKMAAGSHFQIDLIETSSVAEARVVLEREIIDLVLLNMNMTGGDDADAGVLFDDDLINEIPVVFMSSESTHNSALHALRMGAADYLAKEDLTADSFDQVVQNALRRSSVRIADQSAYLSNLGEENATLRRISLRNMRLLKGQVLPLMSFAWRMLQGDQLGPEERVRCAKALSRVTRMSTALIDDTVITAATHKANEVDEPVDLQLLVQSIIEDDLGKVAISDARMRVNGLPVVNARRAQMHMMFEELILTAVRTAPFGSSPEIEFGAALDPAGDTIIWMVENGLHLSARNQMLSAQMADLANPLEDVGRDPHAWSLCQRIVEKNHGQFRIAETTEDRTRIMIRFPKARIITPTPAPT